MVGAWHLGIKATHEEAQKLAWGLPWLGDDFPGVALPSRTAKFRILELRYKQKVTFAIVGDLGPWCHDDTDYVDGDARPRSELFVGDNIDADLTKEGIQRPTIPDGKGGMKPAPPSNGAGIDLFPRPARDLGIPIGENVLLDWRFVDASFLESLCLRPSVQS